MKLAVLVPNLFGARKRSSWRRRNELCVSASERHNQENTRQTVEQSLQSLREVAGEKGGSGCVCRLPRPLTALSGQNAADAVARIIDAGLAAGVDDLMIADTIGTANPLQVRNW